MEKNYSKYSMELKKLREEIEKLRKYAPKNKINRAVRKIKKMERTLDDKVDVKEEDKARADILKLDRQGYNSEQIEEKTGYSENRINAFLANKVYFKSYLKDGLREKKEFTDKEKNDIYTRLWNGQGTAEVSREYHCPKITMMGYLACLKAYRNDLLDKCKLNLYGCGLKFDNEKNKIKFWSRVLKYRNDTEKKFVAENYLGNQQGNDQNSCKK